MSSEYSKCSAELDLALKHGSLPELAAVSAAMAKKNKKKRGNGQTERDDPEKNRSEEVIDDADPSNLDNKLVLKRTDTKKAAPRKLKVNIDDFSEFIPEFLLILSNQKHKTVVRIGKNYQANVPPSSSYIYKYRPLKHLKVWGGGEFN